MHLPLCGYEAAIQHPRMLVQSQERVVEAVVFAQTLSFKVSGHTAFAVFGKAMAMPLLQQHEPFAQAAVASAGCAPAYRIGPAGGRAISINTAPLPTHKDAACPAVVHHAEPANREDLAIFLGHQHIFFHEFAGGNAQRPPEPEHVIGKKRQIQLTAAFVEADHPRPAGKTQARFRPQRLHERHSVAGRRTHGVAATGTGPIQTVSVRMRPGKAGHAPREGRALPHQAVFWRIARLLSMQTAFCFAKRQAARGRL